MNRIVQNHGSEEACAKFVNSKVKEKLRKGYRKDDSKSKKLIEMLDAIKPHIESTSPTSSSSAPTTTTAPPASKKSTITPTSSSNFLGKVEILTRTEVSRLTKAKAIEKFAELGLSTEGFDTVAALKQKLNSFFAEKQKEEEENEDDENEEENQEENEEENKEEKMEEDTSKKRKAEVEAEIPSKHVKIQENSSTVMFFFTAYFFRRKQHFE